MPLVLDESPGDLGELRWEAIMGEGQKDRIEPHHRPHPIGYDETLNSLA